MVRHPVPLPQARLALAVAALCLLAACGRTTTPKAADAGAPEAVPAGYVAPPRITDITAANGQIEVAGQAAPRSTVRLATPAGQESLIKADGQGVWRLTAPTGSGPGLYGLSSRRGDRVVQAEGYVLITPSGQGWLLRAGTGALRLGQDAGPGVTAVDFDRQGAAVVSGRAAPQGGVSAWIDGRRVAEGRADETGEVSLSLSEPLGPGSHDVKLFGDGLDSRLRFSADAAAPLTAGPFRIQGSPGGLRVDWMTPGGGVQSTILAL